MAETSEPTTWELGRRFDRLDQSIQDGFRRMDERLDRMVTADLFALSQRNHEERIASLTARVSETESELRRDLEALEKRRVDDRQFAIKVAVPTITSVIVALISAIAAVATSGAGPF